jgi:uncharacterized protein DUF6526
MDKKPQNYDNHVRFDPPFHFFVVPVILITTIASALRRVSSLATLRLGCAVTPSPRVVVWDRKKEWIVRPENEAPGGHEGECTYSGSQYGCFGCARNAPSLVRH